MGILIAVAIVWFWSDRCFTKEERRRRRRVTLGVNALITAKTLRDLWNMDQHMKY